MNLSDKLIYAGASYSAMQVLRLPTSVPHWLDVRRLLLIGWITVETPGYLATAKVHYRPSHWGIAGTRVHTVYIWPDYGQTTMNMDTAIYRHFRGNVFDRLDDGGRIFLTDLLEYFQ